jgi:ElaB/YqjD/DUF883 family membrane-anchored ribosome-binding protein
MANKVDIESVSTKFTELQGIVTEWNNKKIGLESEVKTLKASLDEEVEKLLALTGQKTLEAAIKLYEKQTKELNESAQKLSDELDAYLEQSKQADIGDGVADGILTGKE